jgi:methionyl-tRNA formyltransferase
MSLNICLIGNLKNPFSSSLLANFKIHNIKISQIILEKKVFSKKDKIIFKSRIKKSFKFNFIENNHKLKNNIIYVDDLNSLKTSNIIKKLKIDFIVQMGLNKIFRSNLIKSSKYGIVNSHPAILPNFRGCSTVEWSILLNQPLGITTHLVTKEIDKGNIIKVKKIKKNKYLSYKDLRTKILISQIDHMSKSICYINKNRNNFTISKKNNLQNSYYFRPINDYLLGIVKNKVKKNYY